MPGWSPNSACRRKKKLKALSKGTRAKVVLSLALAHQPELLMLDEPTSGLDALVRREFLESMVDRAAQGQTVFLSSHQIGEVERVADIVAILRKGKLAAGRAARRAQSPGAAADRDAEGRRDDAARARRADSFAAMEAAAMASDRPRRQPTSRSPRSAAMRRSTAWRSIRTSLEDIFVAYMQGSNGARTQSTSENRLQEAART